MTPSGEAVLEVQQIARAFGDVQALRGVDLAVHAGEIVGLLGPNGAGKTTLVRIIATLIDADAGQVVVGGAEVAGDAAGVRAHIGLAGQTTSLDDLLTGRENLELIGCLYGIEASDARARADALLATVGLVESADRRVGTYSGGMRRRLDLAATLIGEPALLLLDEPTAGLDPRSRLELWDLIEGIARRGTAVLLTSQQLDEVERLADRVVVLDEGLVIADDAPQVLQQRIGGPVLALRHPSLEEAFLALTGTDPRPDGPGDDDTVSPAAGALPDRTAPSVRRSVTRDVATMIGRDWKRLVRTPQAVFFVCVMPIFFVLGLSAVFGDLVETVVGQDYIQFLLPGVLVMQVVLAAGATGVGLATDLQAGIIDRFRSLPMAGVAVLAGRTTTDLARNAIAVAVMVVAGFAIGFRLGGGVARGVAALGVALLFGYGATWVFAAVGLAVKDPQAANFVGFAPVLLFVYLSSAWVPIETMSGAVQGFARNQPVNVTIEAVRALANGTSATPEVFQSIAWSVALIVVFASIATRQLRHVTS